MCRENTCIIDIYRICLVLSLQIPIMEYLEEKYPSPEILPKESLQRAKVGAIIFFYPLVINTEHSAHIICACTIYNKYFIFVQVREICEVIASGIQPIQNLPVLQRVEKLSSAEEKAEWAKFWINKGFIGITWWLSLTRNCIQIYPVE